MCSTVTFPALFFPDGHSLDLLFNSHGYRGIDARRNLWVLPTGELLYYVAAVAVLFDRDEDAQRHYIGHTEDIMW